MSIFIRAAGLLLTAGPQDLWLHAQLLHRSVMGTLFAFPAAAASVCQGSYTASSIRPLPETPTVELTITRKTPANLHLAEEFADGLRSGGVTVAPSGNARLGLSFLIYEKRGSRALQRLDFAWMDHLPQAGNATISLTVMLVDSTDAAFLWVGSIECLIETTSKEALARYIGTVIGRDFGRSVQNRRI